MRFSQLLNCSNPFRLNCIQKTDGLTIIILKILIDFHDFGVIRITFFVSLCQPFFHTLSRNLYRHNLLFHGQSTEGSLSRFSMGKIEKNR